MRILSYVSIMTFAFTTIVGCDKNENEAVKTGAVKINFVGNSSASFHASSDVGPFAASDYVDLDITSGTGVGLQSLKMYFREITICTDLSFSGSGYKGTGYCASIYQNLSDAYTGMEAPTADDRVRFQAAGAGKFYDILKPADLAELTRTVAVPVGTYKYGIVETHPWVKIKAQAGTICTKTAGNTEVSRTGGDGIVTYGTENADLSCGAGTAEEALVYITNANTAFQFAKPFEVTEGASVEIDLAFNMAKEIKATVANGVGYQTLNQTGTSLGFYVPMIRMSPAPRISGETIKTETYTMTNGSAKDALRVILYYNSTDSEKAILGLSVTTLKAASSERSKANMTIYANKASQTGDVVTLRAWDDSLAFSFTRHVSGTPTLNCTDGLSRLKELEDCDGTAWSYPAPTIGDL